jgi:hypothetical protein
MSCSILIVFTHAPPHIKNKGLPIDAPFNSYIFYTRSAVYKKGTLDLGITILFIHIHHRRMKRKGHMCVCVCVQLKSGTKESFQYNFISLNLFIAAYRKRYTGA